LIDQGSILCHLLRHAITIKSLTVLLRKKLLLIQLKQFGSWCHCSWTCHVSIWN